MVGTTSGIPLPGQTGTGGVDVFVVKLDAGREFAVAIDIKPGSDPNSINIGSGGTVPVAILSSLGFDATTIDPTTVSLASAPIRLRGNGTPMASVDDVNNDGLDDLVVHVLTQALEVNPTDQHATIVGHLVNGDFFMGSDSIRVVDPSGGLNVSQRPSFDRNARAGLTTEMLHAAIDAAIEKWSSAGLNTDVSGRLRAIDVHSADLGGTLLGMASNTDVWIDDDAAGYGWSDEAAAVQLATVVEHEFGHVLGFEHSDDYPSIMSPILTPGVRHEHVVSQPDFSSIRGDDEKPVGESSPMVIATLSQGAVDVHSCDEMDVNEPRILHNKSALQLHDTSVDHLGPIRPGAEIPNAHATLNWNQLLTLNDDDDDGDGLPDDIFAILA